MIMQQNIFHSKYKCHVGKTVINAAVFNDFLSFIESFFHLVTSAHLDLHTATNGQAFCTLGDFSWPVTPLFWPVGPLY